MFFGLSILAMSVTGCCACRQGGCGQNGHLQQPTLPQSILGEGYQQNGANLPNGKQTQRGLRQFGQNLGSRFSNGILNRGVNRVIDGAISGF